MKLPPFSTLLKKLDPRGRLLVRRIVGDSMLPLCKPGHIVLATTSHLQDVCEGDVVLIKHGGLEKVKRIKQLKDDRVFVEGDNQAHSTDSRTFGWLHRSTVAARVIWPRPMTGSDWQHLVQRAIGVIGTILYTMAVIADPSWPSPDKITTFLFFVFLMFGNAWQMLKRLGAFVLILLVYESFRGMVPELNMHVHYTLMPEVDRVLFHGTLPTTTLQNWWWKGHVSWYDIMFYSAYMMHYIIPFALSLLVWKFHPNHYWRVISVYIVVSFAGFLTYLIFPAAPPWMASDMNIIPHITHISDPVFGAMGLGDFPTVFSRINPNPVAAVPSLHAAYATVFAALTFMIFGKKWGMLSLIYPILIFVGTVYLGEHYAFDELLGIVYGLLGVLIVYMFAASVWPGHVRLGHRQATPYVAPTLPE
jgi:membrane-associated phospholipid phosphatase